MAGSGAHQTEEYAPAGGEAPSHHSLESAVHWFAALRDGAADDRLRREWEDWIARSDEHRRAWAYVESIAQRFAPLHATGDPGAAASTLQRLRGHRATRRRILGGIAAMIGTGLLSWSGYRLTPLPQLVATLRADLRTGTGEIRKLVLDDGSRLWLNTASAVNVEFRPNERRLYLLAGEILVDTAADPARPFIVDTARGGVRALGTRFTVQDRDQDTLIAVYQGAVEVSPRGHDHSARIPEGRQVAFSEHAIGEPQAADRAREAWADGMLLAEDITLGDLIRELARYQHGHLGVSPEVAHLRVLGGYPLKDPEKVLSMLEEILPIRVRRPLPWWTSIEPAADTWS